MFACVRMCVCASVSLPKSVFACVRARVCVCLCASGCLPECARARVCVRWGEEANSAKDGGKHQKTETTLRSLCHFHDSLPRGKLPRSDLSKSNSSIKLPGKTCSWLSLSLSIKLHLLVQAMSTPLKQDKERFGNISSAGKRP